MSLHQLLDSIPLGIYLVITLIIMLGFIEFGFYLGRAHTRKSYKPQMAQVRAIMGASLGLAAFMLAFGFGMGQTHFEARTQAFVMETNAIKSGYFAAEMLTDEHRQQARYLLHDLVTSRVHTQELLQQRAAEEAWELVRDSEGIYRALWDIAMEDYDENGETAAFSMFSQATLDMMNAHNERLEASVYNRVSPIIWVTLFIMSVLSMTVMGYQGGLTGTRSRVATWTLAFTFSAVMMLITDLDRPIMALFSMNDQIMLDLKEMMEKEHDWREVIPR